VNNGQTISLYVDGKITASLVSGKRLSTFSAPITFGAASLDHDFNGNIPGRKNFAAAISFGDARFSSNVRYAYDFSPSNMLASDANTVSLLHLGSQQYNSTPINPDEPVNVDPSQPINNNDAKPATLFLGDSLAIHGRLMLGKKDWSLSNEIYIRFFEGSSKKVNYYKPEQVKGFLMGDSYYEPKFLGAGGPVNTSMHKTMVKRLTPAGSRMAMYEYENTTITKNASGYTEYKTTPVYFVQLPNTTDDKVYQFSDNKFVPHFDTRVSGFVADKPALADKIKSKNKDYFYAFVTQESKQLKVWWNIINEYNQP